MWSILNFELRGAGHIKENVPCQDKTFSLCANGVTVCALSDGAGSALFSHYGAETITHSICLFLTENFEKVYNSDGQGAKSMILDFLLVNLAKKKKELNCKLKDLAATLLVVAIHDNNCVIIHIGDGIIGCLRNGRLEIVSFPNNGEFVNSTYFVTSETAIHNFAIKKGVVDKISGFTLMSDGTAESLYSKKHKSLVPVVKSVMQKTVLLNNETALALIEKGFDLVLENTADDCSFGIIVRPDEHLHLYDNLNFAEKIELYGFNDSRRIMKKRLKLIDKTVSLVRTGKHDKNMLYKELKYKPKFVDNFIFRPMIESCIISCVNHDLYLRLRLRE
jgi:serine/threonine protein phosphatase PrpC